MNLPAWVWYLIVLGIALYVYHYVRTGIAGKANPHQLFDIVLIGMLVLAGFAIWDLAHGGVGKTPLENLDVCTPPASAWPRAPQPTANLQGCPNYRVVMPPGSIPMPTLDGQRPDGTMPTPTSVANGG